MKKLTLVILIGIGSLYAANDEPSQLTINRDLFYAIDDSNLDGVLEALSKKANPNDVCMGKQTYPLFEAVYKGHTEIVKALLDNKADVNKVRFDKDTPLLLAVEYNQKEIVKILLKAGADVEGESVSGETPLERALRKNYQQVADSLRKYGAKEPRKKSKPFYPPLDPCTQEYPACPRPPY